MTLRTNEYYGTLAADVIDLATRHHERATRHIGRKDLNILKRAAEAVGLLAHISRTLEEAASES